MRLEPRNVLEPGAPDAILSVTAPGGGAGALAVEAKLALRRSQIPRIVEQVRSYRSGEPMIVGPFVSPTARSLLTGAGASFADVTGNLRIMLDRPALLIEVKGADRNPSPDTRDIRSLKGPGAARVVRALADYRPPYVLTEIVKRAKASPATVSRTLAILESEDLLEREPRGAVTKVNWADLLRRWSVDYSGVGARTARSHLAPRGIGDLLARLRGGARGGVAVTGSLAASQWISSGAPRLAMLFVEDRDAAARDLDLREVDAGSNVLLIDPFDLVVFERARTIQGIRYAAPSQVVVDLLASPGRGPAEAEDLLSWMAANENAWRG